MANSIIDFLGREKATIDRLVDDTFHRILESTTPITDFMPIVNYPSTKLAMAKFKKGRPIASVVGPNSNLPIRKRNSSLETTELATLLLGSSYYYTREDYQLMRELELMMAGGAAASQTQSLKDAFFGRVEDLTVQVLDLHTYLSIKVYTTGSCVYTDPLTGVVVDLTYPTISTLFPADLSAGNLWSATGTANGTENIDNLLELFYNENGYYPDSIGMSTTQYEQWIRQDSTKEAAVAARGIGIPDSGSSYSGFEISKAEAESLISRRARRNGSNITITLVDAKFDEEQPNGNFIRKDFWPAGYIACLTTGAVERAVVPIPENDFAGGVFTESKEVETVPKTGRSAALAGGVPLCPDTSLICAQKVA